MQLQEGGGGGGAQVWGDSRCVQLQHAREVQAGTMTALAERTEYQCTCLGSTYCMPHTVHAVCNHQGFLCQAADHWSVRDVATAGSSGQ